jgi:hypothetical protein
MYTHDGRVKGAPARLTTTNKTFVGRLADRNVWVSKDGFYAYVADEVGDYDVYCTYIMQRRTQTSDFVDALWTMLVLKGYASL